MNDELLPHVEICVANEDETKLVAKQLSGIVSCGELVTLIGDLGVGKTTFARAFIQSLTSNKEEVVSPTFTLVQTYEKQQNLIYHFDLYRVNDPEEIQELGFDDALANGIVLVEWPCRLGHFLPSIRLDLKIQQGKLQNSRKFQFFGYGYWSNRVKFLFDKVELYGQP